MFVAGATTYEDACHQFLRVDVWPFLRVDVWYLGEERFWRPDEVLVAPVSFDAPVSVFHQF